jgi:Flp pilus assembly protein TadG
MKPTNCIRRKNSTPRRHAERGTQIAEFAVVLPILVFLSMVVTEGAAFIRTYQIIDNAAREGARIATLPENQCTVTPCTTINNAIKSVVVNYANNNGVPLTTGNVTVNQNGSIPTASGISLSASTVTVTYPYQLPYFTFPGLPNPLNLVATAEFRNLY